MKKQIKQIALLAIVAGALIAVPAISCAQDSSAGSSTAQNTSDLKFNGGVTAVDTTAKTLTVKDLTLNVTESTTITKGKKKSATLSDIKEGETVSGTYTTDASGKSTATTIKIGGKKKKKSAE